MTDDEARFDWTNLPNDSEEVSLWDCLHDGSLIYISSDLMQRTVILRFEVDYVRTFNNLPERSTFEFLLAGVRSVRSLRYTVWPGPCEKYAGLPASDQSRIVAEYQAKWREESEEWEKFEAFANNADSPIISNASLVSAVNGVALRLQMMVSGDSYRDVFFRADALNIRISDGRELTLNEFLGLGEAYWNAFATRREKKVE